MSESGFEGYIGVRQADKGGSRTFKAGRTQESRGRVDHSPLRSCKEFCAAIVSSDTRQRDNKDNKLAANTGREQAKGSDIHVCTNIAHTHVFLCDFPKQGRT